MATSQADAAAPALSDLLLKSLKRTYDMYTPEAVSGAPPTFLPRSVPPSAKFLALHPSHRID
jgi:hypothetical protein